jgi:hypothetical protein
MNKIIISQDLLHYLQTTHKSGGRFSSKLLQDTKSGGRFSSKLLQDTKSGGRFSLKLPNRSGKSRQGLLLHSQFKDTVNFVDSTGDMLSIVTHRNFVPMSMYIDTDIGHDIRIEELRWIDGENLYFTGERRINFSKATVWNPYYYLSGEFKLHNSMDYLKELIINTIENTGIITPLKKVLFNIDYNSHLKELSNSDEIYISKFKDILKQLFNSTYYNNNQKLFENLKKFIGLGSGLTPSGDDFISGFIWGMRLQGKNDLAQSLINHLVGISKTATNDISIKFLNFTQQNKLSIHQKYFIYSLSKTNQYNVERAFLKLKLWGHSSGLDWICGLYGGWTLNI